MVLACERTVATERPIATTSATRTRAWQQVYHAEHHGFWQSIMGTRTVRTSYGGVGERYRKAIIGSLAKAFVGFYRIAQPRSERRRHVTVEYRRPAVFNRTIPTFAVL
jgi:hypothetical protein